MHLARANPSVIAERSPVLRTPSNPYHSPWFPMPRPSDMLAGKMKTLKPLIRPPTHREAWNDGKDVSAVPAERDRSRREEVIRDLLGIFVKECELPVGADAKTLQDVVEGKGRLAHRCRHQLAGFPTRANIRPSSEERRFACVA